MEERDLTLQSALEQAEADIVRMNHVNAPFSVEINETPELTEGN